MSVTNRVYKVLVTNGVAQANMADTDAGQFLVVNADGGAVLTTATAAALSKNDFIQVIVNDPSGQKVYSDRIRVGDITAYHKETYVAKTEQVATWTPPTPVAGQEYTLTIVDKSDKEIQQRRQAKRTYTVVAGASENATTLGDKFRAQINADPASPVVASGTTTVVLTAKVTASVADYIGEYPAQIVFEAAASSLDPSQYPIPVPVKAGTIAATTAPAFGSGNFYQVRKLEQRGLGYTGVTNRIGWPAPTGNFLSVPGTTYDAVVIEYDNRHDTNTVTEGEITSPQSLIIYINAGAGASTIIPILDVIALPEANTDARISAI